MSSYCRCGALHEEDDDRLCPSCLEKQKHAPAPGGTEVQRIVFDDRDMLVQHINNAGDKYEEGYDCCVILNQLFEQTDAICRRVFDSAEPDENKKLHNPPTGDVLVGVSYEGGSAWPVFRLKEMESTEPGEVERIRRVIELAIERDRTGRGVGLTPPTMTPDRLAEYKEICKCIPFVDDDAGKPETMRAMWDLIKAVEAAASQLAGAEKVIAKLPRYADTGEAFVPGADRCWVNKPPDALPGCWVPWYAASEQAWIVIAKEAIVREFYSTSDAALAALPPSPAKGEKP